ncbi:MAG: Type 1 glutamine amidotransferase-like domain-containing protein [Anaerolineae bacterium]
MQQHIIALGGGGFSMEPDNLILDRYILAQARSETPKVCFLPQASAESADYTVRFYKAFTSLGARPSWFSLFGRVETTWRQHLLDQDVIYVGGGNTRSMLALWREWGVDAVLKEAMENGTILAGISAGAICWFEQCVTDSVWPLGVINGLGFLKGSACPHYNGEPERRPAYRDMVAKGNVMAGIALDDGAGAHYVDGELRYVVTSRPNAHAYHLTQGDGEAVEIVIEGPPSK